MLVDVVPAFPFIPPFVLDEVAETTTIMSHPRPFLPKASPLRRTNCFACISNQEGCMLECSRCRNAVVVGRGRFSYFVGKHVACP